MRNGPRRPRAASFSLDACALDGRVLPASGLTASLAGGVLTILGTPGNDVIAVDVTTRPNRPNGPALVRVADGPTVAAAKVRKITILAGEGDNQIRVTQTTRRLIPVRIEAGDGNNTIQTGNEDDWIRVGVGNNAINSGGGKDVIKRPPPTSPPVVSPVATSPVASAPTTETLTQIPSPVQTPIFFAPPAPVAPPSVEAIEQQIIALINQRRTTAGLAPLRISDKLTAAAALQTDNMARLNVLSHTLPGTATPNFVDRLSAVGYNYRGAAENIAWGYSGADDVVQGWMTSSGHRTNILNGDYVETGVAVRYSADGNLYFAQVFGKPA